MTFLSSAELTAMRTELNKTLPGTAVIKSNSYTQDAYGSPSITTTAVSGGTVACRLDPLLTRDMVELNAGRETLRVFRQLTVPFDAPLAADRIVTVGSENYQIVELDDDHSWTIDRRAIVVRLD